MSVIGIISNLYRYQKLAFISLLFITALFITAIFAPQIAPHDYREQNRADANLEPCREYPLGTDRLGRDQLSRIIWGTRSAAFVVVVTLSLTTPVGLLLGALAGYFGGWVGTVVMRLADIMFAFPGFLLVLFMAATLQPRIDEWGRSVEFIAPLVKSGYLDYIAVTLTLAAVGWAGKARLVRALFLRNREEEYVWAAKAVGATPWRIILRHIFPNALAPIIVSLSYSAGYTILVAASLAFLGLGVRPPNADWGAMIYKNYLFWRTRPWMLWGPGAALVLVIAAFSFLGDGLNAVLNPKEVKKR